MKIIRVLGAEVRAIRNSKDYSLLLIVEDEDQKVYTRIHSVGNDRDTLLDDLQARAGRFGLKFTTHEGAIKPFKRGRAKPGEKASGIVRGWTLTRHSRFGIQAWAVMEIETKWGASNVHVLVGESPLETIAQEAEKLEVAFTGPDGEEIVTQATEDDAWTTIVRETVQRLADQYKLKSVWPIQVGYHGKYELAPTVDTPDEPALDGASGSQLPEITAW